MTIATLFEWRMPPCAGLHACFQVGAPRGVPRKLLYSLVRTAREGTRGSWPPTETRVQPSNLSVAVRTERTGIRTQVLLPTVTVIQA